MSNQIKEIEKLIGTPQPIDTMANFLLDNMKLGDIKIISRHPFNPDIFYLLDYNAEVCARYTEEMKKDKS